MGSPDDSSSPVPEVDPIAAARAEVERTGIAVASVANVAEAPGDRIGRYKLLQQIGEGGFGTVWMAEQREPVKRRVALKLVKLGMDTRQVIARFEAERQALALMDHPNIAKVLDAGASDTGRPFFVMELVKGVSIVEYCDTEKLDTGQRLALFTKVCQAIQHAHQKGIIHRDIKPNNVLVTLHDGVPVPKVIDFGIAKAIHQELTEKTLFTRFHQMVGTPAYMSPEQAEMSGLDIDTRSDVYSLGVLLYQLLTGTTPFDTRALLESGFEAMLRAIREDEPPKPSTRVSTLGDRAARTADRRHTDARRLGALLRGDLDWIVMKCLEKDRTRRYETASGLAEDVRRHLEHEPVLAGPPSAGYRLRKLVRRNRATVGAVAAVFAVLVLGVAGTTWGLFQAIAAWEAESTARGQADENAAEAEKQASLARDEAERAKREEATTERVLEFLTGMFAEQDPSASRGATVTVKEVLDRNAARIDAELGDEPGIKARLMRSMGKLYRQLGLLREAEPLLLRSLELTRDVLGEFHPYTLSLLNDLGQLYQAQGRYEDAEPLYDQVLEERRVARGEDDVFTLVSLHNQAANYADQGRYEEAEPLLVQVLDKRRALLGDDDPYTLTTAGTLAAVYLKQGRLVEAEPLLDQTLEKARAVLGEDHPTTLGILNNLAALYRLQGLDKEAEPVLVEAFERSRAVQGEDHPETLRLLYNLAMLYKDEGRYEEAEPLLVQVFERRRAVLGEDRRDTLESLRDLTAFYRKRLSSLREEVGESHADTLEIQSKLGVLLWSAGNYEDAQPLLLDCFEKRAELLGKSHPDALASLHDVARLHESLQRWEEAELAAGMLLELTPEDAKEYEEREQLLERILEAREDGR